MGTDIHWLAEHLGPDGLWRSAGSRFLHREDQDEDLVGETLYAWRAREAQMARCPWIYDERNYPVFAWLAGVRNRYGITPIAPPRGFPADMSPKVRGEVEGSGGHDGTWFLARELNDALLHPPTVHHRGAIDLRTYYRHLNGIPPESWSRAIRGDSVLTLAAGDPDLDDTIETYRAVLDRLSHKHYQRQDLPKPLQQIYVELAWSARIDVGYFAEKVRALQKIDPDPARVRVICFFDS